MATVTSRVSDDDSVVLEWKGLPLLVVFPILDRLSEPADHVRFAAVCKGWSSLAEEYNHSTQRWRTMIPLLMIPAAADQGETSSNQTRVQLYTFSEGKFNNNIGAIKVPIPYKSSTTRHYCGCGHAWLANVQVIDIYGDQLAITLVSPFRKTELELPPLEFYPILGQEGGICRNEHRLPNVSLSADPVSNPDNYVVVAFYTDDYRLAFIKGGQKHWTPIISEDEYSRYSDVVFYKGQVYALENQGVIASFQVNSTSDMDKVMAKQVSDGCAELSIRAYLVESTKGDLLLVQRVLGSFSEELGVAFSFQVYKLLFDDKGYVVQQVEVESIEDEALFVGNNNSVCVLASNFPGCQPNSIYFTDDSVRFGQSLANPFWTWRSQWDMGIFNFDDKTITQLHPDQNSWDKNMPPAIWIAPPFKFNE